MQDLMQDAADLMKFQNIFNSTDNIFIKEIRILFCKSVFVCRLIRL